MSDREQIPQRYEKVKPKSAIKHTREITPLHEGDNSLVL